MNIPNISAHALASAELAVDMAQESDAIDALIQDGMEASLLGLNDRTWGIDSPLAMAALNTMFAVSLAILGCAV